MRHLARIAVFVILAAFITGAMPSYGADCGKALFGWTASNGTHINGTLSNEGGWVNNPSDSGGETYRGITKINEAGWSGWAIVKAARAKLAPQPKYGTKAYYQYARELNRVLAANAELQSLVVKFYHDTIWKKIRGDEIKSQYLAYKLFDLAVNMYYVNAIMLVEKTINDLNGKAPDLPLKGVMTDSMVAWLNSFTASEVLADGGKSGWRRWCFFDHLKLEAMERYGNIIAHNAKLAQFWATWRNRAENDA